MDIFSKLPEKHTIIICYCFVVMIALTIALFAIATIFASPWKAGAYVAGVVILFGIFSWTLKGGVMKGNIGGKGVGVELESIYPEDMKIPETAPKIPIEKLTNVLILPPKREDDTFA